MHQGKERQQPQGNRPDAPILDLFTYIDVDALQIRRSKTAERSILCEPSVKYEAHNALARRRGKTHRGRQTDRSMLMLTLKAATDRLTILDA